VDGYQRQRPDPTRPRSQSDSRNTLNEANQFLRQLIPFPGVTDTLSPLSLLPPSAPAVGPDTTSAATAIPRLVEEQATSIVSQAAAVLDEEMARGVLAARRSYGPVTPGQSQATNPLLRQAHDLVDNIAAMWPGVQRTLARTPVASPSDNEIDSVAELKSKTTVRPGQRATVAMTLSNKESLAVRLVPTSTDLIGSRGGRITSALLEFTPTELSLEPQEQRDLTVTVVVPAETAPGCYSGLLVVKGVDYLRALITIEVG
jgi:hypothetical protein